MHCSVEPLIQAAFIDFIIHTILNGVVIIFVMNIGADLHCHVSVGQKTWFLYTTVMSKIFLEDGCSFFALNGGEEVKFIDVLEGILKSV